MKSIKFDYSNSLLIKESELKKLSKQLVKLDNLVKTKRGAGAEFLGWYDLPINISSKEINQICVVAEEIR
ncbi:MAG TPA: glucose-6-phosphate isomerase, partial [bacterium]|nr:glucose-6-phosphate isomerase [bacterium]